MKNSTTEQKTKRKIFWAIDPTQNPSEAKNIIKELKIWSKRLDCDVQPVAVISKFILNLPIEIVIPWNEDFVDSIYKAANKYLKKSGATEFLPPEIIFAKTSSHRRMASFLAKYAEKKNAYMIFANTRAKKTWNPLRLGGFAETLVVSSKVPVLLLNSLAQPSATIPSILFPTDFSNDSKNALMSLQPLAEAFKSKVILYHQVGNPNYYVSEFEGPWQGRPVVVESMLKDMETSRTKDAKDLAELLKQQNVRSSILVQRGRKNVSADIVEIAKKNNVNLIALASSSGPVTQAILGSVSRDVLLQAHCPVLIFHRPQGIKKLVTKPKQKSSGKDVDARNVAPQLDVSRA